MLAHVGGLPVEETLLPLISGTSAGLLMARYWVASRKQDQNTALLPNRQRSDHREQDRAAPRHHSIAGRAMAGGWRPARSQPAAAAAKGTPTTMRTSGSKGIRPR